LQFLLAVIESPVGFPFQARGHVMVTRQALARWAVALAAALLAAPGCSSGQTAKKDASIAPSSSQAEPPKELTLGLGGGVTMKLVLIPAGKFMMGSPDSEQGRSKNEGPQHEVAISKPFYVCVTEVTQAQYEAVMGTNPSHFKGATNPVEKVSWDDATEFCKKLSEKTRQAVRLPTEAEWEYACRAGSQTLFSFGDVDSALGDFAWYWGNSGSQSHPVGQKRPNAWGLYDMHGNVWEWCADWFGDYPKGAVTDPQGPASGAVLVLRGGSWLNDPWRCRSGCRDWFTPVSFSDDFGFRVVVSVSAPGP
jgi:formylglycine-generating enzyme required for sulfatase activity